MPAFLLTWNPTRFDSWNETYWLAHRKINSWSCGARKDLPRGSVVYLLRQGGEPRGIVASGRTVRAVYQDTHWDPARRRNRVMANYVDVHFNVVLSDTAFRVGDVAALRGQVNWRTQMSGIRIPDDAAERLRRLWAAFVKVATRGEARRNIQAMENTLTEATVRLRRRARGLRDRALFESQGICEACRIDFGRILGGAGRRVLQVHHRRQLASADTPRITRLSDLAVVCANCHALIHSDPKRAMSVEALRRKLRA